MLAPIFHAWERRLASVSKDRVVRPFEWGIDWITENGHHDNASAVLEQWVEDALRDSQAFFTAPPTSDFEFVAAGTSLNGDGEAGTLRYPSAHVTPHAQNNIVVARWFPAKDEPPLGIRRGRGRAVLVLPQWNSDAGGHIGLSKLLARFGISALRLSLPYHDTRMPPELTRADYIVSSNIARTVQVCRQAVLDARRAIQWLSDQGFERIGILGTSLGSCLSMLTTAHEPLIKAAALNHISPYFADVVWNGLSTMHVREGLDGHIDLERLRRLWMPISPMAYLDALHHVRSLLVYARYDLTFPVRLSRMLVDEFRRREISHDLHVLPCGHYSTGVTPFKWIDGLALCRFLNRSL